MSAASQLKNWPKTVRNYKLKLSPPPVWIGSSSVGGLTVPTAHDHDWHLWSVKLRSSSSLASRGCLKHGHLVAQCWLVTSGCAAGRLVPRSWAAGGSSQPGEWSNQLSCPAVLASPVFKLKKLTRGKGLVRLQVRTRFGGRPTGMALQRGRLCSSWGQHKKFNIKLS